MIIKNNSISKHSGEFASTRVANRPAEQAVGLPVRSAGG